VLIAGSGSVFVALTHQVIGAGIVSTSTARHEQF
jgi:hypothetical protein